MPEAETWRYRDYVLLSVLYDTGARIQELLDLKPSNFHLDPPPFVRLRGKGRRERLCPLLPQSAQLVGKFLATNGRRTDGHEPLLQNGRGMGLGRHGARYILLKYLRQAADLEMKRKALESATGPQATQPPEALPSGLIEWLESL